MISRVTLPELFHREQGLVLPCDEHVADAALHERRRRAASAGVEHGHVSIELAYEITRARLVPL